MLRPNLEGYKEFTPHSTLNEHAIGAYQKRVVDDKGTKYFINCYEYGAVSTWAGGFDFEVSLRSGDNHLTVNTVQWFNKEHDHGNSIEDVEAAFEKIFLSYGGEYYELDS